MKKILIFFFCLAQFGMAQQVNVVSLEKVKETESGGYYYPVISPNSDFLLLTKSDYRGLVQYDFAAHKLKRLNDDRGAGYGVQISEDGTSVLHKRINMVENRRYNSLVSQDLSTGEQKVLIKPTRDAVAGRYINSQPAFVKGKKMVKASVKTSSPQRVITIENGKMTLYTNGKRKEILPNGKDVRYIWPSVSPDGKMIAYTVVGHGTFVCGIDGKNVKSIGKLNAPKWAGNLYLVGMDDVDDGEKLIKSDVYIVSADGKYRKKIDAPAGVNGMYPSASMDGSKIAFNTEKGEIYIVNVELK